MPCYFPLTGYRAAQTNQNGKRPLTFGKGGFSDLEVQVPCGQCIGCRLERSRQWAIRLMHERQFHDLAIFVTLTYNDDRLPAGGSLDRSHVPAFIKRLRASIEYDHRRKYPEKKSRPAAPKIKYFHCGEYGENFARPHYHAIIYGVDFPDKVKHRQGSLGDQIYTSQKLSDLWGHGFCEIGNVSFQSCAYVARYCTKKINGDQAQTHYQRIDEHGEIYQLVPEYSTQSNGLGLTWLHHFTSDVFPGDRVVCEGKESAVPRYYRKKLAEHDEQIAPSPRYGRSRSQQLADKRKRAAKKRASDNTPERLAVKHQVKLARISTLSRNFEK